jgi:hypothetical protein
LNEVDRAQVDADVLKGKKLIEKFGRLALTGKDAHKGLREALDAFQCALTRVDHVIRPLNNPPRAPQMSTQRKRSRKLCQ